MRFNQGLGILTATMLAGTASAQYVTFQNQTSTRMPTGGGQNDPAVTTACPDEKDYAWADLDNDGDTDLVCVRKIEWTFAGGRRNVLFMNEGGVLIDRASTKANTAINVPGAEGVSQGFLDATNDRDVVIADVNNDGWLDVITATTISDGLPRYIGHPRVYFNLGSSAGVWQGLRYDYSAIPQLLSKPAAGGVANNPRFCSLAVGDLTGDGYADLIFGDYDTGEVGPAEAASADMDNKILINRGAVQPGYYDDQTNSRWNTIFSYPGIGNQPYAYTTFGAASVIIDMNGDGINDVVKQTSLTPPQHVAVLTNSSPTPGTFSKYVIMNSQAPYFVSAADLNNDNRMDLILTDDGTDHYHLNQGNDGLGQPTFNSMNFSGDDGFGSQSVAADLNNDGWKEVLIADIDVDTTGCARRTHIYHNRGNAPNVTLTEADGLPGGMAAANLTGTHNIAVFDINGDGWQDIVLGRCSTTEVWMNLPPAALAFSYPVGIPTVGTPDTATNFTVNVTGIGAGVLQPGSQKLFYSLNGGAYQEQVMPSLGGNSYQATLPAAPCGSAYRFYVSATTTGAVTFTDPSNAPTSFKSLSVHSTTSVALDTAFEGTTAGFTVQNVALTGGAWGVADPNGTINSGVQASPENDATLAGSQCFVTENGTVGGAVGAADVDGGPTHLISPAIDLTGTNGLVSFNAWHYAQVVGDPVTGSGDVLTVAVSNNGSTWVPVMYITGTQVAGNTTWQPFSFNVANYVTPNATVQVRFSSIDTGTAGIVESGIDDFHVDSPDCAAPCPADIAPAGSGNGVVDIDDLTTIILAWGSSDPVADINNSGLVDIDDLTAVILAWGNCP